MRQNIINSLNKLFLGTIHMVQVTYSTPKSHDVIKFSMLGHEIQEENGLITIYDNRENNKQMIPKTVNIDPLAVDSVIYEDDMADEMRIYERSVVVRMNDGSQIKFGTVGMG